MVARGDDTSAGEASVLRGEGVVLRKGGAGLSPSETPGSVVSTVADVGALVRELHRVVSPTGARLLLVVTTTSVEIRGAGISGLVGENRFPAVVCTAAGPAIGVAVLEEGPGVGTGGGGVLGVVAVTAGGVRAKRVLVAGRVGSVEDSVKAGATGIPEAELTVSAPVASVGKDSQLGDFDSVATCSWCGLL